MRAECTFIDEGITLSLDGTRAILLEDVADDGYVNGTVRQAQIPLYPEDAKKLKDSLEEAITKFNIINESHKGYEKGYASGLRDGKYSRKGDCK